MSSLHVFVYFGGEWDEYNNYIGYYICGVIVPDECSYNEIVSLISKELKYGFEKHQYTLQYQAMQSGPRIRIDSDTSLAFYLGLKRGEAEKRNYPLCVDVSHINPIPLTESEAATAGHFGGKDSSTLVLHPSGEPGPFGLDLVRSNPTIEEMGNELVDYIKLPSDPNVESLSLVINHPSSEQVTIGNVFKNKDVLVTSISLYAINNKFQFRVVKSDYKSYEVKCFENTCNWTFRASRTRMVGHFKIRRMAERHICSIDMIFGHHRQANSLMIVNCIKYRFLSGRRIYTLGDVIEDMKEKFGVTVSYDMAWRSRERAIKMIRGDLDDSYGDLPSYIYMLKLSNPRSYTKIETDEEDKFLFSFVALGASIAGWRHCKPAIVVDETFLTGKYRGTLFKACTQDANNNIFILAFGIGDAENNNAWDWFMLRLREVYGDRDGICIVSDRHESIKHAVENVYPNALHGACTYHILQNIRKTFGKKAKGARLSFNAVARAYTLIEFDSNMRKLDSIDKDIRKFLVKIGFERWSRAHMTTDRYSTMTSNIVESVNSAIKHAKKYPIVALFECLRSTIQKWFFQNLSDERATFTWLSTRHNAMLNERVKMSMRLRVHPSSDITFQVNDETTLYVVNMEAKTCSCRRFQLDHLPCPHTVAVISSRNYSLSDYCSIYFSKEKYIEVYQGTIYRLGNKEEWHVPQEVSQRTVLPPELKQGPGRPKENRFKSSVEYKNTPRCGRCDSYGHNSRTCRNPGPVKTNTEKKKTKSLPSSGK